MESLIQTYMWEDPKTNGSAKKNNKKKRAEVNESARC